MQRVPGQKLNVCCLASRTEELLVSTRLLNNLDKTRPQLLDGGDVGCKDTHLARLGGDVDLDAAGDVSGGRWKLLSEAHGACRVGRTHPWTCRWTAV